MINNELDVALWRRRLAQNGRVQITDFLQADAAEALAHELEHTIAWTEAEPGMKEIPAPANSDSAPSATVLAAQREATGKFHFNYDRYLITNAMREGRDAHLLVHRVLEFFNGPQFLAFVRYLSGDEQIIRVGAQATRYRPGQFLRTHNDKHDEEGRRFAYVINLSRRWAADWGGLLQFTDAADNVTDTFLPRWNSLSLFKVPTPHCVSLLAPWAEQSRLSITGWWHVS